MTREELVHLVDTAHGGFPMKADANTYRAWWLGLQHHERKHGTITLEAAFAGIAELIAEPGRTYPPSPGALTEILFRPIKEAQEKALAEKQIAQMKADLEARKRAELEAEKCADPEFLDRFWEANPDLAKKLGRA